MRYNDEWDRDAWVAERARDRARRRAEWQAQVEEQERQQAVRKLLTVAAWLLAISVAMMLALWAMREHL